MIRWGGRRKAFADVHRCNEDCQTYISASRRASPVIAKAKAETWHTTSSSLLPKSDQQLYTLSFALLLVLLPCLPSLLTSLTVLLPRNWLLSMPLTWDPTFLSLSQRPCVAEPEATFLSSAEPRSLRNHTRPSVHPSPPLNFLRLPPNLSSSTATGPDKVAYPMLKHLPRSGMDFLLYIFNVSWTLHFFLSIWKTSSIILIHKMGKSLDSPASLRPISVAFCESLFECILLSRLLFFLEFNSILSPGQASFRPNIFLSPSQMGLTNPNRTLGRSSLLLISQSF